MITRFGKDLNPDNVLREYPRPQMVRGSYVNLNGVWEYAITKTGTAPSAMDGTIVVPFSPESPLSGVMRTLKPDETLWYTRTIDIPDGFEQKRVLLHFGAVDQIAEIYVNGIFAGKHTGGYTAFTFDITPLLCEHGNTLTVKVKDFSDTSYHSRGKQKTKRGGIWYTPQSGIWQTVWLECVPQCYIDKLVITPFFDQSAVEVTAISDTCENDQACMIRVGDIVAYGTANRPIRISMEGFRPWSPESPYLYQFEATLGEDRVQSYFAMRKFSVDTDQNGVPRLMLNNKPYFHNGVLDQGYWPDGLYTAPSDEAFVADIIAMKSLGYNTLRKHIKIEPLRFYYHCDRLGMLVWQDMPSGGSQYKARTVSLPVFGIGTMDDGEKNYARFARENEHGRKQYYTELNEMILQLYNCPCIALWVPFNEGWGQFDAAKARDYVAALDRTRTIDHASGWHDQGAGDVKSLHVYGKKYEYAADKLNRPVVLSEFGGFNLRITDHCHNKKDFGYKRMGDNAEFKRAFKELYSKEIAPAVAKGLSAAIYTQLSDVEDELNGLMTYDREVEKLPAEEIRLLFAELFGKLN